MLDLLDLAERTRQALATAPEADDGDVPLNVHEAILLVDSIAPASIEDPPPLDVAPVAAPPAPPTPTTSSTPARRRLRAIYSGAGLLVLMATMVLVQARMGREVASAAALRPDPGETTALLPEAPQTPSIAAPPVATTRAPTAPPATTATTSPKGPPRAPAPPRPRPPVAADTPDIRAAAEPTATPRVDLLDAMAAAVAARSAPPAAPKGDCPPIPPGRSGTPSPCARAGTRTSPLRP